MKQTLLERLAAWLVSSPRRQRARARLLAEPFPDTWHQFLNANVAVYRLLPQGTQESLHNTLRIFVAERRWEGCGGLTITDEIQVTIAAQACLLLLGMEHDYFSQVSSILVYPSGFQVDQHHAGHGGLIEEEGVPVIGQAWRRGPVILAWDEVLADGREAGHGHNVVYHEFAHQLDFQGDWPHTLGRAEMRELERRWNEVMTAEYERLIRASEQGRATLLDDYGATSPAEFFAVSTECFFELPVQLQRRQPRLYEILQLFYGQDPAEWFGVA
jgi:Mlc titration factor MtfA (ptsG expression regulator)